MKRRQCSLEREEIPYSMSPLEARVLDVVREFVAELRASDAGIPVTLDSVLEEDLGIHSLERLELLVRLEASLPAPPPDDAIAAERVRDLTGTRNGNASTRPPDRHERLPPPARPPRRFELALRSRIYTAWVALLLAAASVILWPALHLVPRGRPARRLLRRSARLFLRAIGVRLTVDGLEHLENVAPAVLVVNHESYVDSTILLAALPIDVTFVANERLPASVLIGTVIRSTGCLIVDRRSLPRRLAGAARIEQALRKGESLLVFPESTLAPTSRLLPFRLGGFASAVAARRPIVPITLRGTRRVLPSDEWRLERGSISVAVHPPIRPKRSGWRETLRLRDEARRHIESVRSKA